MIRKNRNSTKATRSADGHRAAGPRGSRRCRAPDEGRLERDPHDRRDQRHATGPAGPRRRTRRCAGRARWRSRARRRRLARIVRMPGMARAPRRRSSRRPGLRVRRQLLDAPAEPDHRRTAEHHERAGSRPNSSGSIRAIATTAPITMIAPATVSSRPEVTTARSSVVSAPTRESRSPVRRRVVLGDRQPQQAPGQRRRDVQHQALGGALEQVLPEAAQDPADQQQGEQQQDHPRNGRPSFTPSITRATTTGWAGTGPRRPARSRRQPPAPGRAGAGTATGRGAEPGDQPRPRERRARRRITGSAIDCTPC